MVTPMPRWWSAPLVLVGLMLAAPASGQVAGTVVERERGAPVPGAIVRLLGPSGENLGRAITSADGSFRLGVRSAGTFTVRLERIGYATVDTALVISDPNVAVSLNLIARTDAIRLDTIQTRSAPRCGPGSSNLDAVILWNEARKALEIAEDVREGEALSMTGFTYLREYDRRGRRVVAEERTEPRAVTGPAFVTRTPSELSRRGFVVAEGDSTLLIGPTAEVLLSDEFLAGHCFQVQRRGAPSRGMIGLAFQPVPEAGLPGIAGVLWLEESSGALHLLDFVFRNHDLPGPADEYRGSAAFARSEAGLWYVSRWALRSPLLHRVEAGGLDEGMGWDLLVGIREQGGEVIDASPNEAENAIAIGSPDVPPARAEAPSPPAVEPPIRTFVERPALDSITGAGGDITDVARALGLHAGKGRFRSPDLGPHIITCISTSEVADWPPEECPMVEVWLNGRRLEAAGLALLYASPSMFERIGHESVAGPSGRSILRLYTRRQG
ncbi:MAG: carboxypeptidase regulatory-like domain-containing protein [Gemmatimonadales bacterium]|nr:MAG: carboxypeptidase regulatory-like domain-containing protein [Gemmatimonadales bacterium]